MSIQSFQRTLFSLIPNNNTIKVEIKSSRTIHFQEGSIGKLLGFTGGDFEPNRKPESHLPVDITRVNVIRVACNSVSGSFQNCTECHVMPEFYPQVPLGYKIVDFPGQ